MTAAEPGPRREPVAGRWRVGGKPGHIYAQRGDQPSDADALLGVMDTKDLAETACSAVLLRWGPSDMNRLLTFLARANIKHQSGPLRDDQLPIEFREIVVPGMFRALFDEAGVLIEITGENP